MAACRAWPPVTWRQSRHSKLTSSSLPQSALVAHWSAVASAAASVSPAIIWSSLQVCAAPSASGLARGPAARWQPPASSEETRAIPVKPRQMLFTRRASCNFPFVSMAPEGWQAAGDGASAYFEDVDYGAVGPTSAGDKGWRIPRVAANCSAPTSGLSPRGVPTMSSVTKGKLPVTAGPDVHVAAVLPDGVVTEGRRGALDGDQLGRAHPRLVEQVQLDDGVGVVIIEGRPTTAHRHDVIAGDVVDVVVVEEGVGGQPRRVDDVGGAGRAAAGVAVIDAGVVARARRRARAAGRAPLLLLDAHPDVRDGPARAALDRAAGDPRVIRIDDEDPAQSKPLHDHVGRIRHAQAGGGGLQAV